MKLFYKRFVIDIDETISQWNDNRDYLNFIPNKKVIEMIDRLYTEGHHITLFTARGMGSEKENIDKIEKELRPPLEQWLSDHNVKYHRLIMGKPQADYYIDDKNLSIDQFVNGVFEW